MQRNLLTTGIGVVLALFLAFSLGCGNDHHSTSNAIAVQSVQPADQSTCIDVSAPIQITFNAAADPNTVNTTNIQIKDATSAPVTSTVTYDAGTHVATLTPAASLASNTSYTISVSGVSSAGGKAMAQAFTSTFQTGPCAGGQAQFKASLFPSPSGNDNRGEVDVDSNGVVTAKLVGATASTTFTLNFCPAPTQDYSCFKVGEVTTDGSGNASTTMNFPQSGSWAGDFHLDVNNTTTLATDLFPNAQSPVYSATLQPSSTTNGKGIFPDGVPGTQDPLSSGTVTLTNGQLQFQLQGASPATNYGATECPTAFGSSCFQLVDSNHVSGFTTDSSGNVTFSVLQDGSAGDIFRIDAPTGRAGFVGGFKVP